MYSCSGLNLRPPSNGVYRGKTSFTGPSTPMVNGFDYLPSVGARLFRLHYEVLVRLGDPEN